MSEGGEAQGAEEAFMGQKQAKNHHVSFVKEPVSRERLFLSARKTKGGGWRVRVKDT